MIFFILILLLIISHSITASPSNKFVEDYISKKNTTAIKGIFVILIVFSHATQYINLSGPYDPPYVSLKSHLDQMVVSMFLFYSGYGIMESIYKKGFSYIKSFPVKRCLKVLINFDIAVLLYLLLNSLLGQSYSLETILFSMIGWKSVGNSNWYIFAVLVLYIFTFAAFYLLKFRSSRLFYYYGTCILTFFSLCLVYFEMKAGQPTWCYNTIILYSMGCWYSLLKNKIEPFVQKNDYTYTFSVIVVLTIYMISFQYRWDYGIEGYTIWAIAFTALVLLFTMKFTCTGHILNWFGDHVFSIYMMQRIPMILLNYMGISKSHKYMFIVMCFLITIFIAQIFDYLTDKIWKSLAH